MFNSNNGYSLADVAAATGNNRNNDAWGADGGWFIWIILIFAIFGWGGFGNGFGNGATTSALSGYATQADLQRGFDNSAVQTKLDAITNGISTLGYDMLSQMNGLNQNVSNTGFGIQTALCNGFNGVNAAIAQNGYQAQQCCCETKEQILQNRYENAQNTASIINAINNDGNATRALITQNTIQDLRDKVEDKDRELQSANYQISQLAQTSNLINTLRPTPIPAYLSCSPYQSQALAYSNLYGTCGCGSCNN